MIVRIGLGLVFISSGAMKLFDLDAFSKVIEAFAILSPQFCYPFAVMISLLEISIGFGLTADIKGSLAAIFLMLLMFVAVLSYAILMGYDIDCGCFGPKDPETKAFGTLKSSIARDLCMITLVVYLWRFKNKSLSFLSISYKNNQEEN